jgi:hypothetical protein
MPPARASVFTWLAAQVKSALRQFCERARAKSWQQRERGVARYR